MWQIATQKISSNLYCHRQFVGLLHQVLSDVDAIVLIFVSIPFSYRNCLCLVPVYAIIFTYAIAAC